MRGEKYGTVNDTKANFTGDLAMIKLWRRELHIWEKRVSIPIEGPAATAASALVIAALGIFLLRSAIEPPAYLPFLKDSFNLILYGVVGSHLILRALRFCRKKT